MAMNISLLLLLDRLFLMASTSHSCVTATILSASPRAMQMSVTDGRSEQILIPDGTAFAATSEDMDYWCFAFCQGSLTSLLTLTLIQLMNDE